MKLSHLGGVGRRRGRSAVLLLAALVQTPLAGAQEDDDAPESEGSSVDLDESDAADEAAATEDASSADSASADSGSADSGSTASADEAAPSGNPEWHSPLRVLIGSRLINRSFRYTDALSDLYPGLGAKQPVDYPRFTLPMPRAELRWYPGAHFTSGWLSQLGIVGGYEIAVGARLSYDSNGDGIAEAPVSEHHDLWFVGARGRIPIGNIALGLQVDYATHSVTLSGDEDTENLPTFPDVAYRQVELGADVEWRIDQLVVGLHGSYNVLLGLGQIGLDMNPSAEPTPWFPGSTGSAVDFGAYAGWRLSRVFDILVGLDLRAYGLDFGEIPPGAVDPANRMIAGGATDRYMSAWLALAIKLPAKGTAPAASGDTPAAEADAEDDFGFD